MTSRNLPPNPYIDLRLAELAEALSQRAHALLEGQPSGRRDVAYLLIAAAAAVRPSSSMPNAPARTVAEGTESPEEAFGAVLKREQIALRYWVYRQAVDAVGGLPPGPEQDAMSAQAVRSDEDCLAVLRAIGERAPGGQRR